MPDEDVTLYGLVESIFPLFTEQLFISWNDIHLAFWYQDLGVLVEDMVEMCSRMLSGTNGTYKMSWVLQGFESTWDVSWDAEKVHLHGQFDNVFYTGIEGVLNTRPDIRMAKADFLAEWRGMLANVAEAIDQSGVGFSEMPKVRQLRDVLSKIPQVGVLYRDYAIVAPPSEE